MGDSLPHHSPMQYGLAAAGASNSADSDTVQSIVTSFQAPDDQRGRSASHGALRGIRRLEERRNVDQTHYLNQKARTINLNPPFDMRMLDYVSSYDENLVCPICRCPFVDPVLLSECEHCFCRDCIRQTWTDYTPHGPRGPCPTCRTPGKLGPRSATSKILRNIVDDLLVKCPNHEDGCKVQVKRGEARDHVALYCGQASIECSAVDCELSVRRQDEAKGCLHYGVSCIDCHQSMHVATLEQHWQKDCPDREVACRFCQSTIYYRDLKEHNKDKCPASRVPCPGQALGCAHRGKRAQAEVHANACPLANLAPILTAQMQRIEAQEVAQRQMSRKLELMESSFAKMQDILHPKQEYPDATSADEDRIPFLQSHRRTGTSQGFEGSALAGSSVSELAELSLSGPLDPSDTLSRMNEPTSPYSPDAPYTSPLHHLLSMHESLREEMSRVSTALQELDGRHSMQHLNENLRIREEMGYLGAQISGISRQVQWLMSSQLQRQQGRMPSSSITAGSSRDYQDPVGAGTSVEATANAVSTAATALRGAVRMVNSQEGPGSVRRGLSEEGRTKL